MQVTNIGQLFWCLSHALYRHLTSRDWGTCSTPTGTVLGDHTWGKSWPNGLGKKMKQVSDDWRPKVICQMAVRHECSMQYSVTSCTTVLESLWFVDISFFIACFHETVLWLLSRCSKALHKECRHDIATRYHVKNIQELLQPLKSNFWWKDS